MIAFKPTNKREEWIKLHFGSKSNLVKKTGLSRPTIDRICKDNKTFYKHLALLSKSSGSSVLEIIESIK